MIWEGAEASSSKRFTTRSQGQKRAAKDRLRRRYTR